MVLEPTNPYITQRLMKNQLQMLTLFGFIALLVLSGSASAYDDNGTYFTCYNCTDCTNALNDNTRKEVRLGADITNYAARSCIDDPANFINKTFDCQGHTIDGNKAVWTYGIFLDKKINNTIQNCIITDFDYGIYLNSSSSNNTLINNTANNNGHGIYLADSSNNTLTNNTANNNTWSGIYLHSSNNTLTNNIANNNNNDGIYLKDSSNNALTNNIANNNSYGIYLKDSSNNALTNNIANNNSYGIRLDSSSNNTLINNTANDNDLGIFLYSSSNNNTLINNTANDNDLGIYFQLGSTNNKVNSNTFCSNSAKDIYNSDRNSGANNTCITTHHWNDNGTIWCTHICSTIPARKNYSMSYEIEGTLCAKNPVIVHVFDENGDPAERFDVDVYLGNETLDSNKVAYGLTDNNGSFTFTPVSEGVYRIKITAKHYNQVIPKITVISCANCSDGIQNQNETGIDCGGPCAACPAPSVPPTQPATGKFPLWIIGIIIVLIGGVAYYLLVIGKKEGKG